jgi:hypothetical protein
MGEWAESSQGRSGCRYHRRCGGDWEGYQTLHGREDMVLPSRHRGRSRFLEGCLVLSHSLEPRDHHHSEINGFHHVALPSLFMSSPPLVMDFPNLFSCSGTTFDRRAAVCRAALRGKIVDVMSSWIELRAEGCFQSFLEHSHPRRCNEVCLLIVSVCEVCQVFLVKLCEKGFRF